MSGLGHFGRAALVLGWLGSSLLASAQGPPALRHPVRLTPGRRSLGAVLAELSRQSRLPFSYSSSLVPLAHRYQVRPGPARPAGVVLREVLAAEHLAYGVLDGQVVLWPDHAPTPPGVTAVNGEPASAAAASATASTAAESAQLVRPLARVATAPQLSPSAKPPAPVASARATSHPASSRLSSGRFEAEPTSRPATLAAGHQGAAGVQRAASGSRTLAAASTKAVAKATTTPVFRPGTNARYQPGRRGGGAIGQGRIPSASPRDKTSSSASDKTRALALLPLKSVGLPLVNQASTLPDTLSRPAGVRAALAASASPAPSRDLGLAPDWKSFYLHGEAWVSESLPVGAVAKVGVARAYLVLGVAVAASGRGVGGAFGVGLGTAGRARGRFTPSLDVMHWFLGHDGDEGTGPTYLTQLRPLLTWQLRREGRWALVLGPTLNLATADSHGAPRGNFGRNQLLLLDKDDERSSVRFWPGVQVGLRF